MHIFRYITVESSRCYTRGMRRMYGVKSHPSQTAHNNSMQLFLKLPSNEFDTQYVTVNSIASPSISTNDGMIQWFSTVSREAHCQYLSSKTLNANEICPCVFVLEDNQYTHPDINQIQKYRYKFSV